jgi:cysteine desulfurase/selenocysteine lyase
MPQPAISNLAYDIEAIRADFPILSTEVYGEPLVFLDSAASAQKPRAVIDSLRQTFETGYANIHRGVYHLSQLATEKYEAARETVRAFINASHTDEVIFVRSATEAINLIANSWGGQNLREGDEIVVSEIEHHSNIVPWQLLRQRTGCLLKVAPVLDNGALDLDATLKLLDSGRVKLLAITHMANSIGTIMPVRQLTEAAHAVGAKVLVDGCQGAVHMPVDVQSLDVDFYAFSAHKLYGPTGIGALYGKRDLLDAMPPYQGGGDMISRVTFEESTWAPLPNKFEAGTPAVAEAIAFGAAIDYVNAIGLARIAAHEYNLLTYALDRLRCLQGVRLIGTAPERGAVISFVIDGVHPHDAGTVMDRQGVAVRVGQHCAEPTMARFGVSSTLRVSFGLYNTMEEVDILVASIDFARDFFT